MIEDLKVHDTVPYRTGSSAVVGGHSAAGLSPPPESILLYHCVHRQLAVREREGERECDCYCYGSAPLLDSRCFTAFPGSSRPSDLVPSHTV